MQVEAQLSQLPPPPAADHGMELFRRLHDMGSVVQRAVDGEDDVIFFKSVRRQAGCCRLLLPAHKAHLLHDQLFQTVAGSQSLADAHVGRICLLWMGSARNILGFLCDHDRVAT
jgi:hypothetical protein